MFKYLLFGCIGGALGMAVWIGVGYASGYEVGYIAWGIGFLVGIGVRVGAGDNEGFVPGAVATAVAIVSILIAKYAVVSLLIAQVTNEIDLPSEIEIDTPMMIASLADEIVTEREENGQEVELPPEYDDEEATYEDSYPPDIWAEAKGRWEQLSEEEQQQRIDQQQEQFRQFAESLDQIVGEQLQEEAMSNFFSPWDLLWFGLAAFTAFKIGSGAVGDEEE